MKLNERNVKPEFWAAVLLIAATNELNDDRIKIETFDEHKQKPKKKNILTFMWDAALQLLGDVYGVKDQKLLEEVLIHATIQTERMKLVEIKKYYSNYIVPRIQKYHQEKGKEIVIHVAD